MLEAVLADGDRASIAAIARSIDIPVSTAHRQVATLVAEGYLTAVSGGRHLAGPRLLGMLHRLDEKRIIAEIAVPSLDRLARDLRTVVQLGTFENDMVTYRVKTGTGAPGLFTKVGMQLEAYCSGIGKVLLAHLPEAEREAYLAAGPFPALTPRTLTAPDDLRAELGRVGARGYAIDDGEIAEGMVCVAAPIRTADDRVCAAISATFIDAAGAVHIATVAARLLVAVHEIEAAGFGRAIENS